MKKTALLHHWLNGMRGGEKVLEILCELNPEADIYTLFYEKNRVSESIGKHSVFPSGLNQFSLLRKNYSNLFLSFPFVTEQFDLTKYDLVISSDSISMKGVITSPDCCHICYCHTPPRYVWDSYFEYLDNADLGKFKKMLARVFLHIYRQWDAVAANRVDYFVANSNFVARRIAKFYRRKAYVVNPPVSINQFSIDSPGDYYLSIGQLVPYKRIDLLVDAFNHMPEKKLKIIGTGPSEKLLRKIARTNIEFVGWVEESRKVEYYQKCKAFLFPGIEDFGITPLEAQACGRPIIAYGRGGVLDTVKGVSIKDLSAFDPKVSTGIFYDLQTKESIIEAVTVFEKSMFQKFDSLVIRKNAESFSEEIFRNRLENVIKLYLEDFDKNGPPCYF